MRDDPRDGNGGFAVLGGAGGQQMVYVCDSSRRRRSTLLPLWTFSTPRSALLSKKSCRRRGRRRQKPVNLFVRLYFTAVSFTVKEIANLIESRY